VLIYRAPQVAAELLRAVLAQLPGDDPGREALEAALVQAAFLLVLDEELERVGTRMLARALDPDRAAEIAWLVAYTLMRTGRPAGAAAVIEQALARPGTSGVHAARLRALHALILTALDRVGEAARIAGEALASAETTGDKFAAGYALHALSRVSLFRHDWPEMMARMDRALAVIGDDPQTTDLRLLLMMNRFGVLDGMDRRGEAIATAQQALALAERAGTPRLTNIRAKLAAVYYTAGRWDDALAQLETAITVPGTVHSAFKSGLSALIAGHRDDQVTAEDHLTVVADISVRHAAWGTSAGDLLMARAVVAERAGRADEAQAVLAQCLDPDLAEFMPDRYELLPMLTRLALAAGHTATAAGAQAAASEADEDPLPLPARTAVADHCRGLAEADPARVLAAAESYRSCGRPLNQAQALEDAAVLLAARGELEAARAAFTEAVSLYDPMGADWDIRRADTRLRPYGIRRARRRRPHPAAGWEALTPTEIKIADLVATGQSNPDIAAALFLSRNTVQTHVSHILAKLGARSRAEIAREALQHPPRRVSAS
jgi:DNA-binding CsgD family transcriptional regulator